MKGKGTGGKGDGRCHTCGGEGHFASDRPSVAPVGPQYTECHGCDGRGHFRTACPTANPHQKSAAKGAGKGKSGGKGKTTVNAKREKAKEEKANDGAMARVVAMMGWTS